MKHLSLSFFAAVLFFVSASANDTFIYMAQSTTVGGTTWKFLDNGTNQGTAWRSAGFNDLAWNSGASELGYGDGDENTVVNSGGATKFVTTYFRKTINIANPSTYTSFILKVKRDDGIIVYVNGVEVFRDNMGTGTVTFTTLAALASDDGEAILSSSIPTSAFIAGDNIIAVEIHQNSTSSSDITFDMELTGNDGAAGVTRGPYLQMGGETSITLRWQTDVATNSRVEWGSSFGSYPNAIDDATVSTTHSVSITGLNPDTKYYYRIGSNTGVQQEAANNYFLTLPPANTTRKLRFAAIGDCGNNSANQVDSKNALLKYIGNNEIDALITLGDNAYSSGLDAEFQTNFFNVYQYDILRYMKLYTAPGNHDYGNSSANTGVRNNAYYTNFVVPDAGQLGGVASGTEAYYSFNVGDVHFVSLDSYGRENSNTTKVYDTLGAQATWVKNDLAANTKRWVVVYYHHPPYTKTSHDSDTETDLRAMRENFIRILERYGVDLVLCGHSHGYERSYLLKNYFNSYSSPLASNDFRRNLHTADSSSAIYNGTAQSCAYNYNSGRFNHGSVYVVAGSAGQIGGSASGYPHKAMVYSNNTNGGSLYFEVDSNRLDAKFISYTGSGGSVAPVVRDQFTIFKDVNKVTDIVVAQNAPLRLDASWRGTYHWPANGNATTQTVTPSTATPGTYDFVVRDAASGSCLMDSFHVVVSSLLPVKLKGFNASIKKEKVLLSWTTAQENNNNFFTIERSGDGVHYENFGQVKSMGNSTSDKHYTLADFAPLNGRNFYRLSQTDLDNHTTLLDAKMLLYKNDKRFSATFAQAGIGGLKLNLDSRTSTVFRVKVTDMAGKEIYQEQFLAQVGTSDKTIALGKGVYAVQISDGVTQVIQKLVIK